MWILMDVVSADPLLKIKVNIINYKIDLATNVESAKENTRMTT